MNKSDLGTTVNIVQLREVYAQPRCISCTLIEDVEMEGGRAWNFQRLEVFELDCDR